MANSEYMQAVIREVAIQADMVAVKAIREAQLTTEPHTRRNSQEEPHKPKAS